MNKEVLDEFKEILSKADSDSVLPSVRLAAHALKELIDEIEKLQENPIFVYEIFDDIHGQSLGIYANYTAAATAVTKMILEQASSRDAELEISGTRDGVKIYYEISQHRVKE